MSIVLNPLLPFSNQVTSPNQVYIITGEMDLAQSSVIMQNNCVLYFDGGLLKNGTITGNNTRIVNPLDKVILNDIELHSVTSYSPSVSETGWLGECKDIWFNYSAASEAHYKIVKSVCQFEVCSFTNRIYFIEQWRVIHLRPYGCIIRGGNATFIITGDKGEITSGWANLPQYRVSRLFEKASYCLEYASGEEAGCFLVSDLTIEDNEAPSNGNLPDFVFYVIFSGSANHIKFRNVRYDGPGGLWNSYNTNVAIHSFEIVDCNVRTRQFAFELGNVGVTDDPQYLYSNANEGGSCEKFYIKDCTIYNYVQNVLVGPLSVVTHAPFLEKNLTKELIIENSCFESESLKNLEVMGCKTVWIRNSVFKSVFCSSDVSRYSDGSPVNKDFYVVNNLFGISENSKERINDSLRISAGDIFFINNTVIVDFSHPFYPDGFRLKGYGYNNMAIVSGNHFIIKGTNRNSFKSLLFYEDLKLDLIGNTYSFTEGIMQGHNVSIGGRGPFIHLETEDDPRFYSTAGGGFNDWKDIPESLRAPDGVIKEGEVLSLDNSYPYESFFVDIPSFEIDLKVRADGLSRNGWKEFLSFQAGTVTIDETEYDRIVRLKSYYGTFYVVVSLVNGNSQTDTNFSSGMSLRLALPTLGFDTQNGDIGYLRFTFISEEVSGDMITRVTLFINDVQLDTFLLNQDILEQGVSSVKIYGSSYLKIMNYRLRTHVKTIQNPAINDRLTFRPNPGYAKIGPSNSRPVSPPIGFIYFDTDYGYPIFYTGSHWVKSDGLLP